MKKAIPLGGLLICQSKESILAIHFCGNVFFDRLKAFGRDNVFDAASVLGSRFFIHTQTDEHLHKDVVTFQNALCDLSAGIGQGDNTAGVHRDASVFSQILHGDADTRLGKFQLICDVDRTYLRERFL